MPASSYRAGEPIEDFCRACKTDRAHTIIVVDGDGQPLRVTCDYCESQHNYRGGPRIGSNRQSPRGPLVRASSAQVPQPSIARDERTTVPMPLPDRPETAGELERLLRQIIREESGLTPVAPAPKWRGGTLVLRPATPGMQEKSWPIETFFHKVVMLRNRLRTLEQQVNASELPEDVKMKLQSYVTGCYGSLTSFNVLFASEDDQFKGNASD
jgi:hypothetical protein